MSTDSNQRPEEGQGAEPRESGETIEPVEAGPRDSEAPGEVGVAEEGSEVQAEPDQLAKVKDQLLRTAADFDNFRKRSRRDVEDAERRGREEVVREVLPVIDNLERAVEAADKATEAAAVAEGVRMVLKQFEDIASRLGLERLQAVGERFDPSIHDAVQQMETDEQPPGTIVAEVVPGYRLRDRLLRAALVVVARPPSGGGDQKA